MRNLLAVFMLIAMIGLVGMVAAQQKAPPTKLVFTAKNGDVTYDHAAHAKREKNDCKICHPAQWPQDAKAPLNYKAGMHKTATTNKTSCGMCHRPDGQAFTYMGNCTKCHAKKG